jgi:hypothetical protein
MISIFNESPAPRRGVSSVVLSSGLHIVGVGLLSYGVLHAPRIQEPIITEKYSVRRLDLHSPEPRPEKTADGKSLYPRTHAAKQEESHASTAVKPAPALPEVPQGVEGKQTLVQPLLPQIALLEAAPVPTVVIWTPESAATKQIVAPLPVKPSAVDAPASLDTPNEEPDPGSIAITATDSQPDVQVPPPGTTSPLVAHTDSEVHTPPATVFSSADQPTPTAVLSISDVHMTDGTIVLPPVNETHSMPRKSDTAQAVPSTQHAESSAQGAVEASSKHTGGDPGQPVPAPNESVSETTEHIQMSKDGKFGVVVVGTSLAEEYPQTLQIWNDRVAYTAYLHVGLTKNWILQYAQLRSAEATSNGTVARVEAPWPYDIMRPNLVSRDLNADALMVHGILNESGRLESLAIAFPERFSQAAFVLRTLQQWQFRPARQLGKPTSVEILLIIPDELD